MKRFLEIYWVFYFIGYIVAIAILLWLHWNSLIHGDNPIFLLAAVFGVAAGSASAFAIIVEVGGRMVLLIPATVKKLKDEGRAEGREEGRAEGREEGRAEGREEGIEERQAEWEAWLKDREEAEAEGRPFDEPPPSRRK